MNSNPMYDFNSTNPIRRVRTSQVLQYQQPVKPLPDQYYYSHSTSIAIANQVYSREQGREYREMVPKTFWEKCKSFLYYPILLCKKTYKDELVTV